MNKVNIKEVFDKIRSRSLKENFARFLGMKGEPSKIALSVAVGLFVGLIVPMGLQTFITVPICILLDCNIVIAITATLISNPFTIIPIYILAVRIGEFISPFSISPASINAVIIHPTFDNLIQMGTEGLILILLGTFIMGTIISVAGYFLTKRIIIIHRKKLLSGNTAN